MLRLRFFVLFLALGGLSAAEDLDVRTALSRPVLNPNQATMEVQVYTGSRVPAIAAKRTPAEWTNYADRLRKEALERVILRGEARRWSDFKGHIEWSDTIEGPGYRVRKLRYEVVPGLWTPALLYEPSTLSGKVAAVLNVNGHDPDGNATNYIQERCINLAKRGLLALNVEWFGKGQLDTPGFAHYFINDLDLCGTSGVALHFLSQRRALDILLAHEHADPERVAVTGLSGGGWQTIFISSLDTRVKLANPVAGYSSFVTRAQVQRNLGDSEQTPSDLATVIDYTHMTAMLAPRPALLTNNATDECCFRSDDTIGPLMSAAMPVYELFGKGDRLRYHINFDPGSHNYLQDNRQPFYEMLHEYFFNGSKDFPTADIPSEKEVREAHELYVKLPADNLDFHQIALNLSKNLPRERALPAGKDAAAVWRSAALKRLQQIVHPAEFKVTAEMAGEATLRGKDGVHIRFWRIKMNGGVWTVPAVELEPRDATSTVIVLGDRGRRALFPEVARMLAERRRVIAIDPFYFGESWIGRYDYLYAMLLAAEGERPLGVQASQVAAISRWMMHRDTLPTSVAAFGPRTSLIASVAAALEPAAITSLELHGSFGSLREVIENKTKIEDAPELFCFGLLEQFDIKQLLALIAPRGVTLFVPSERAGTELRELAGYYKTLGVDFNPLTAASLPK